MVQAALGAMAALLAIDLRKGVFSTPFGVVPGFSIARLAVIIVAEEVASVHVLIVIIDAVDSIALDALLVALGGQWMPTRWPWPEIPYRQILVHSLCSHHQRVIV